MDLVELIFYQKMQGVKRCPHGDAVAVLEMDDFFAAFVPKGFIRETELTEQEE